MKFFAEEKAKKEGDSSPKIINNRETFGKAMIEQHSNGPLSHTYASQKGKKNAMLLAINDDNEDSDWSIAHTAKENLKSSAKHVNQVILTQNQGYKFIIQR